MFVCLVLDVSTFTSRSTACNVIYVILTFIELQGNHMLSINQPHLPHQAGRPNEHGA